MAYIGTQAENPNYFANEPTSIELEGGTYNTDRLYRSSTATVTGDITLSNNLVLARITDKGNNVTLTSDGTTRIITGSGKIESGNIVTTNPGNFTGMTGTIGSGVTGGSGLTPLQSLTSKTAVASTSGTYIDFTSIPSWAKQITVMLNGVSTNGTSNYILQLGHASAIETSGYLGAVSYAGSSVGTTNFTAGVGIVNSVNASYIIHATLVIALVDASSFKWAVSLVGSNSQSAVSYNGSSSKSLSAALDRVRITTMGGTETFDTGTINILYA